MKTTLKRNKNQLTLKGMERALDTLNMDAVLKSQVRQVRWLYNNSNKCTMVYEEKLVRLMVFRLQQRISELENNLSVIIGGNK